MALIDTGEIKLMPYRPTLWAPKGGSGSASSAS